MIVSPTPSVFKLGFKIALFGSNFIIFFHNFRRNEYQLTDSVQYFLDNVNRIATTDYVPTLQVKFQRFLEHRLEDF